MGILSVLDGAHLTTVRDGSLELTQVAETGREGTGQFVIDDTAGTQAVVGQKDYALRESSCANTRTFDGFVDSRQYGRNAGQDRAPHVGAARGIAVQVVDLNNLLSQTGLTSSATRTSRETVAARGAWLVAHAAWPADVAIGSRVDFPADKFMSSARYLDRSPGDVLADMATAAGGYNYYVADWGSGPELTFRDDNASTDDSSAVRISNVAADVDSDHTTLGAGKTFFPSTDFELIRSPREVYSDISLQHSDGRLNDTRAATAAAFNGPRFGTASNSDINDDDTAAAALQALLGIHATERDELTVTIQVPASAVNLLRQGERCEVKASHFATEGYGSFTWCRVLERTVKPLNAEAAIYELKLKLAPQDLPPEPDICSDLYDETASDTYYPLGGNNATKIPNPSDGVVYYYRSGLTVPLVPTPGYIGSWHFPIYGAGGSGTIDIAGDCTQNRLVLMTVGDGEWTIQTERHNGVARAMYVAVGATISSAVQVDTFTSGDPVTVTIDDTEDGDCIRVVVIGDRHLACGSGWGWSEAEWVAA